MQHEAYPDATATAATSDWSYVSEGGASIVFSYVGPSHPIFSQTVLRLRKSPRPKAQPHRFSVEDESDDSSVAFQAAVTSKLVPKAHLPRLQTVKVSPEWLHWLSATAETHRPAERTTKDGIDESRCKGVLATDLVGGKGWAVEIKPKWGFLPTTTYLSPTTLPLKAQHCRYCMHAHFKDKKQTPAAKGYCPLDLFSGDETRMRRALTRLWEAWIQSQGRVNNLRVFANGNMINPGDSTSFGRLAAQFTSVPTDLQPQFIDALLPLLTETPLLSTISHLQRTLDSLDIEGLSRLWSKVHPDIPLGQGVPDPSMEDWSRFVTAFQSGVVPKDEEENLRYNILAYLLSATFKDCSIIIRDGIGAGRPGSTITAIDLDPKSPTRLAKWEALDREIVENFATIAAKREACVDTRLLI